MGYDSCFHVDSSLSKKCAQVRVEFGTIAGGWPDGMTTLCSKATGHDAWLPTPSLVYTRPVAVYKELQVEGDDG